jgi:hypothetical protein
MKKFLVILFLTMTHCINLQAQISFDVSNTINLKTDQDILYLETRLIFNTGMYFANDYRFYKIYDSLDVNWFVSSCFNGDCKTKLLDSGTIDTVYGLSPKKGFIAFHVEPYQHEGISKIIYKIVNTKNSQDTAFLNYIIEYSISKTNAIGSNLETNKIQISNNEINIRNNQGKFDFFKIFDANGKEMLKNNIYNDLIEIDNLYIGTYFVELYQKNKMELKFKLLKK